MKSPTGLYQEVTETMGNKQQGKDPKTGSRASFVEVFRSIKFSSKRSANGASQWPEPGFVDNHSQHVGVAALDDYKDLIPSSN